jgi:ADP-ribosyl-[dinitrogen reductase] hydrolase
MTDLCVVRNSDAGVLVSLVQEQELKALGVPTLGREAEALGLEWHHLPITDMGVPDETFETRWTYEGNRLRRCLARRESLVLHCMGGLGRTGTVAARLLVEFGVAPEDAIARVREARPGAIENARQEQYVRRCVPVPHAGEPPSYADRVLGCLLGGALGDAFGYAVEFASLSEIRRQHGADGLREPVLSKAGRAQISDDSQMTMFSLEACLDGGTLATSTADAFVARIHCAYLDWLDTQGTAIAGWRRAGSLVQGPVLRATRAPGNTCLSALKSGVCGTVENRINNSKGCGGVMRVAPIGLLRAFTHRQVFDLAARAAAITHGQPSGCLSAGALAAILRLCLDGADLASAAEVAVAILGETSGGDETASAVTHALILAAERRADHPSAVAELGEGWVGEEALAIGLYAALVAPSFEDASRIAANHSGDSDSTGSIAAQIYGVSKGLDGSPHPWVRPVDALDPLLGVIARLLGEGDQQTTESARVAPAGHSRFDPA